MLPVGPAVQGLAEGEMEALSALLTELQAAVGGALTPTTLTTTGNADIGGTLGVDGAATFDGDLTAATIETTGNADVGGTLGVDGAAVFDAGLGVFGHAAPGSAAAITGALSTVADAPAKAVLTSVIAAVIANGQATNGTT